MHTETSRSADARRSSAIVIDQEGTFMSQLKRRAVPVAGVVVGAASLALAAAPASAKTTTLHFFQKTASEKFVGASGKPIPPFGPNHHPKVGDSFVGTDLDYTGNHKHHAARPSASDRLTCKFVNDQGLAKCHGGITIGKSTLLLGGSISLRGGNLKVPIIGGTGKYAHAHGLASSVSIGDTNNSDIIVKFTT